LAETFDSAWQVPDDATIEAAIFAALLAEFDAAGFTALPKFPGIRAIKA